MRSIGLACAVLAGLVLVGCGETDRLRAKAWLGGVDSQLELAHRYSAGDGVTPDEKEAVYWYRKAAEQGDVGGQYHLGLAYLEGAGVTRDYDQAAKWFRKAAEQGISLDDLDLDP